MGLLYLHNPVSIDQYSDTANDAYWGGKQCGASTETTVALPEILVQPNSGKEHCTQFIAHM
jgi:hypothetical protein